MRFKLQLLLLVGAKLEHIITELAQEVVEKRNEEADAAPVKPSDELFWFHSPNLFLYLVHFILFQNSFEIAFLFWVWVSELIIFADALFLFIWNNFQVYQPKAVLSPSRPHMGSNHALWKNWNLLSQGLL